MQQLLSICGSLCDKCDYYDSVCQECFEVKDITFWSKELMAYMLPLYKCAMIEKNLASCGKCPELPC